MVATAKQRPNSKASFAWLEDALMDLKPGEYASATGVPWSVYKRLADFRDEQNSGVRIAFDRGRIELMSPKYRHEKPISRLARVVAQLARAFGLPFQSARSTTLEQESSEKGVEPDDCFYLMNAEAILDVEDIDLSIHPPPDLAIEIDSTNSSVPKEPIYSSMKVPELWRWKDGVVTIRVLGANGVYSNSETSLAFGGVTAEALTQLLEATSSKMDENQADDYYREWAVVQKQTFSS